MCKCIYLSKACVHVQAVTSSSQTPWGGLNSSYKATPIHTKPSTDGNKTNQTANSQLWLYNACQKWNTCGWTTTKMRCLLSLLKDVKDTICVQAREREIQFHCVYHGCILMSGINVLQLNHIQKQTGCEMNVKGAISKTVTASQQMTVIYLQGFDKGLCCN